MKRALSVTTESWPIAGKFTISRGSKTSAEVIVCNITDEQHSGHSECVPYARYGETLDSVCDELEAIREDIESGAQFDEIIGQMPAGAARNALDCAVWDLLAKKINIPVHKQICETLVRPLTTAITISLGTPEEMAADARKYSNRDLIKVKLGSNDDAARIRAVAAGAPNSRIIVDANEGWTSENLHQNLMAAAENRVALIEQPLPANDDQILAEFLHPVVICADESAHTSSDLQSLKTKYDAVNIKLDKAGGLTEAIAMRDKAHEMGFSVMVGCMVGTSLAMAPAVLLAQNVEYVDLDGPLLLAEDRPNGLDYFSSTVSPPSPKLWG